MRHFSGYPFFFFNDTATTEIYTLSLHDALPIWMIAIWSHIASATSSVCVLINTVPPLRSEEHTSELQSPCNIVCRLLLEKKNYEVHPCMTSHLATEKPGVHEMCVDACT